MRFRLNCLLIVFLCLWGLLVAIFFVGPYWRSSEVSLNERISSLELQLQNALLENNRIRSEFDKMSLKIKNDGGPSLEYEKTRRIISRNVDEFWRFVSDKLSDCSQEFVEEARSHYSLLKVHLHTLEEVDGYGDWRKEESQKLSALLQKRLHTLQNPSNCSSAKKLICNLNKGCGYGCQIHHAIYCFIVAYGTQRTLLLKSKGWRYEKGGFEEIYKPLSNVCSSSNGYLRDKSPWPGSNESLNIDLPIIDSLNPRPIYLPPSIPSDLSTRIIRLHGNPIVWWIAQFLKYMLRPQNDLNTYLNSMEIEKLPSSRNYIGIHVRRTDKVGTEAAFHPIEEYMKYVEERFEFLDALAGAKIERNVYVASDDPKVLGECRKKFLGYNFFGDISVARSASVSSRYSTHSLKGIITDIHLLSLSEYLVCTFSSQVCRIAYELLQNRFPDASNRFKSLDDIWYFGGQYEHEQIVRWPHTPKSKDEIALIVGDILGVAGNHWNGFNKGRNHRNNRIGLYPEYKTEEIIKIVDFPIYPEL